MVDVAKLTEPLVKPLNRFRPASGNRLVLEIDLTDGLTDEVPSDPLGQIMNKRRQRLTDLVEGIRRGAQDPRVLALIARIDGRPLGLAQVQELRSAVAFFAAAGKPTLAWSDSFGEFGPGTVPYYLACAFSEIAMLPTGTVGLTGISVSTTFLKGAVDKLGVEYQAGARHEYKNALNTFTESGFTEPHREATGRIVESVTEQLTEGIAQGRSMTPEKVSELISRGPFLADEALEAGLVDRLAYRDEIYADLLGRFHGPGDGAPARPQLQFVTRYHRRHTPAARVPAPGRQGYIALISATGMIMTGRSRRSPLGGAATMGSDTVAAAFRAAREDPHVRAVVFRVDSRGGSPVASDIIRRESELTSRAGTPVVTSMGEIAGSGGYYVALGSDAIVAQPGTLTGSIGVYTGKAVLTGLLERLGMSTEAIDGGEHAGMFQSSRGFSETEWERVNAILDHVYEDFTGKVARARGMTREQVHEVARGRVWTGHDARERGLVDALGGLETAVRLARAKAGVGPECGLRSFPRLSPLERLKPAESSEDRASTVEQVRMAGWGPLAPLADRLGLPVAGPLVVPGSWEIR